MGCNTEMIGLGAGVELEGVIVELYRKADSRECDIKFTHDCLNGSVIRHANIGKTRDLQCYTDPLKGWTFEYVEFVTDLFVRVEVCAKDFPPPEPEPEPEPEDLTDYEKIKIGTQAIVDASVMALSIRISDTANLIDALQKDTQGWIDGVTTQITDQTTAISGLIGEIRDGLGAQITTLTETLTGGVDTITERIDGLTFPTLDSIKAAFLDVCADLALALWDSILDKIEERYPKDEDEGD